MEDREVSGIFEGTAATPCQSHYEIDEIIMARSPARTICHPNLLSGSTKGNRPQLLAPAETVQNQTSTVGPTPLTLSEREAAALPVNQCRGPLKNEFLFAF